MGRPRAQGRPVDPAVRELFAVLDASGLSMQEVEPVAGVARSTLSTWRRALYEPKISNVRAVLNSLGFDLAVVRKEIECSS